MSNGRARYQPASSSESDVRRKRAGFTLLELTLVIALLAILFAVAVSTMLTEAVYGEVKTRAAADALREGLVTARTHAIEEGRAYSVSVVPGTSHYRIAPDDSPFGNGAADSGNTFSSTTPAFVKEDTLPGGIRFNLDNGDAPANTDSQPPENDSVDPSQWSKQVTFLPDGTAVDDKNIVLHIEGSRPLTVRVRALTGRVTVGSPETENGQP
jgi:prepilin-type N-terminal cleavage/methylation domain-containing protein